MIDSEPLWRVAETRAMNEIGVPIPEDDGLLTMGLRTYEVVERKQVWLLGCRRLGVCYERRAELLHQACALICGRYLAHTSL